MLTKNRTVGLILMAIGLGTVVVVFLSIAQNAGGADPGPRIFPLIGGAGLMLCGGGIFLSRKEEKGETFLSREGWKRIFGITLSFIIYTILLKTLGFLAATLPFVFAVTTLFKYELSISIIKRLIFSVVTTVAIWLVFVQALNVLLPKGILF